MLPNDITGVELDDIAGNDLFYGNFLDRALPQDRRLYLNHLQQLLDGLGGSPLLPVPQQTADQDDG